MASEYLQDMEASYARKSWNAVVRRAQEVVELSLKGVLSYLGVDFPKVHDPAAVFVATVGGGGGRNRRLGQTSPQTGAGVLLRAHRRRPRGRGSGG